MIYHLLNKASTSIKLQNIIFIVLSHSYKYIWQNNLRYSLKVLARKVLVKMSIPCQLYCTKIVLFHHSLVCFAYINRLKTHCMYVYYLKTQFFCCSLWPSLQRRFCLGGVPVVRFPRSGRFLHPGVPHAVFEPEQWLSSQQSQAVLHLHETRNHSGYCLGYLSFRMERLPLRLRHRLRLVLHYQV